MKNLRLFVLVISFLMFVASPFQLVLGQDVTGDSLNPSEDTSTPVNVKLYNNSSQTIQVHVLSFDMIHQSYVLDPKSDLDITVEYGNAVRLEYPTCPNRTDLKPVGTLNELTRTVLIRDDEDTVFIEEKFSGSRGKSSGKTAGTLSIPAEYISDPPTECQSLKNQKKDPNTAGGSHLGTHDKYGGENLKEGDPRNLHDPSARFKDKSKEKTRKEDPTQPENKTERDKKKEK